MKLYGVIKLSLKSGAGLGKDWTRSYGETTGMPYIKISGKSFRIQEF